jgi:predicted Zn-ribbon and HTH transcriptional regulator
MVVKKKCRKCGLYTISSIAEKNPICPKCISEGLEENDGSHGEQGTDNSD